MYEVVHTRLLYILLTAAHCGLCLCLWSLRMARHSVCTIRSHVSCSLWPVCLFASSGVCSYSAKHPLWAAGPGEPCAVVECDR